MSHSLECCQCSPVLEARGLAPVHAVFHQFRRTAQTTTSPLFGREAKVGRIVWGSQSGLDANSRSGRSATEDRLPGATTARGARSKVAFQYLVGRKRATRRRVNQADCFGGFDQLLIEP